MKYYTDVINAAVKELGKIALEDAKKNCPVRTGRLKRSIKLHENFDRVTGIYRETVGTKVRYAKVVEFGRGRRKPRHFLGGAVEKARSQAPVVFSIFFRGSGYG